MDSKMNTTLIVILAGVSAWSLYNQNLYILITNICVVSGVLIDDRMRKMLMKENANIKRINLIKKAVPILYVIGVITLLAWAYSKIF